MMHKSSHLCVLLLFLASFGAWKALASHRETLSSHSEIEMSTTRTGGLTEVDIENSVEKVELAKFAVDEHNKKTNGALLFERLVAAKQQVVAGTLNHLTIQASGQVYEAKVWEKPWENFRSLEGFAPTGAAQTELTPAAPVTTDEPKARGLVGGVQDTSSDNGVDTTELAQFALTEHNKKTNSVLSFEKVISSQQQVVQGTMHILRIQASGQLYDAKIWEKPWESFRSLEEFTAVEAAESEQPSIQAADLGTIVGGGAGLREVDPSDPAVQEASEVALKYLQQSSNSLVPYTLTKVNSAKAEVKDGTTFHLTLLLDRGGKEETVATTVHRTAEGKWSRK